MVVRSRWSPLLAAVAVGGLLFTGTAFAQDKPPAGTQACTDKVAASEAVKNADASKKAEAITRATGELCAPAGTDNPPRSTTTSSSPTSSTQPGGRGPGGQGPNGQGPDGRGPDRGPGGRPPGPPPGAPGGHRGPERPGDHRPDRPGRPAGDRDCADFPTQDAAQRYFESIGGSRDNNADRLDANRNGRACEDFFDDGDDQGAAVSTTGDDGSSAATSGTQVRDVPEGSAQTGGA